ncbi:MAG: hypothetical protein RIA71_08300 [Oceanicaulis sp.]
MRELCLDEMARVSGGMANPPPGDPPWVLFNISTAVVGPIGGLVAGTVGAGIEALPSGNFVVNGSVVSATDFYNGDWDVTPGDHVDWLGVFLDLGFIASTAVTPAGGAAGQIAGVIAAGFATGDAIHGSEAN